MQAASYSVNLSTHKNGKERQDPVWIGQFRLAGKQGQKVLGKAWEKRSRPASGHLTEDQAVRALEAFLEAEALKLDRSEGASFATVTEAYIASLDERIGHGNFRNTTKRSYVGIIETELLPLWGHRPIRSITQEDIKALHRKKMDQGRKPGTMNQYRAVLLAIFKHGIEEFGIGVNQGEHWKRFPVKVAASGRIQFYEPDQIMRLVAAVEDPQDAAVFLLASLTGLRFSEFRALRWNDISFGGQSVLVERGYTNAGGEQLPKSNKVRSVPLMPQVAEVLQELQRREYFTSRQDLVFVNPVGGYLDHSALSKRFRKAQVKAGLPIIKLHDLRHSFGTMAVRVYPVTDVQAWMGHADLVTTMRYIHFAPREDAAARLGAMVDEATAGAQVIPIRRRA